MFMEKVGQWVTAKPGMAIVTVILITLLLFSGVLIQGLDQTFDEESFLPDVELAKADQEIGNSFAREYSVTILVKGKNGNILTPEAQADLLELEKAISEDPELRELFENPAVPSSNFNSVADQIFFIAQLQQTLDGMELLLNNLNGTLAFQTPGYTQLAQLIAGMNTSNNAETGATLLAIDTYLTDNSTIIQTFADQMSTPPPAGPTYDEKIAIMRAMTQEELTGLITTALMYDGAQSGRIRTAEPFLMSNFNAVSGSFETLSASLAQLRYDPNLMNSSLYGNTTFDLLDSINNSVTSLMTNYMMLPAIVQMMDITNTTIQLDTSFSYLGFGLGYLLTSDFQPQQGSFNAKGTLLLVYFNASIGEETTTGHGGSSSRLELEKRVQKVTRDSEGTQAEYSVIGGDLITDVIMESNNTSLMILLSLAVIFVIIILFAIYRNFFDMGISFLALGMGILWMYGAGAWLGFTFNPITTMVPILIVGLGIDYSIHLIMRYREEQIGGEQIKGAMTIAITFVGTALLLATVTTVVAFMSNLSSPLILLGEFGILAAIGITGCFISMTVFLPAAKQLRDSRLERLGKLKLSIAKAKEGQACKEDAFNQNIFCRGIALGATAAARSPAAVIGITILVTLASFYGAYNLETKFDFEDFLPEGLDITDDINYLLEEFSTGSLISEETVSILVKGDIADPGVMNDIAETISNMEDDKYVNTRSIIPFNGNNGNNGNGVVTPVEVPDVDSVFSLMQDYAFGTSADPQFTVMYMSAFDETGGLRSSTTKAQIETMFDWLHRNAEKNTKFLLHYDEEADEYDAAVLRISITVNNDEAKSFETLDELNDDKDPLEENPLVESSVVTGGPILFNTIMSILNESQLRSLIITVIACAIILTIVFWFEKRSLTLGVITTFPVVLVISWSLGFMYVVDIPLNIMTITIASLTVGLGVTYGIHITHRFLENIGSFPTIDEAGHNTVMSTGIALFGAAATTIAAFGMLVFALLPPIQQFGGIAALTIFFSFISCVFILPTFLRIWANFRVKRGTLKLNTTAKKHKKTKKKEKTGKISGGARCGNCGEIMPEDAKKCPGCGVSFGGEWFECPECRHAISADSPTCKNCGASFEAVGESKPPSKKKSGKSSSKKKQD